MPDQEIFCGEGMFFGLGTSVKFPADYSESPYSIIATGVTTFPQKVSMPFSLLNTLSRTYDLSPAYNEIYPGWVLRKNMYMLQRNSYKYRKRAGDLHPQVNMEIFRPEIMSLVQKARQALAGAGKEQEIYTEETIPPIGKHVMTEQSRREGLEAYDLILAWVALKGLTSFLHKKKKAVDLTSLYTESGDEPAWEITRGFLKKTGLDRNDVATNLEKYLELCGRIEELTFSSRAKDERRGKVIMNDYMSTHIPASEDPVILDLHKAFENEKKQVDAIIRIQKI
jgi:hypothetical protein